MKILQPTLLFLFSLSLVSASSITYTLFEDETLVKMEFGDSTSEVTSKEFIEDSGNGKIFLVDEALIQEADNVEVILPEGFFLTEDKPVFPRNYQTRTDGKNIVVYWENPEDKEILIFYESNSNKTPIFVAVFILALVFMAFIIWQRSNKRKSLSKNLFKEEKKIVELLSKNKKKGLWTKEISKQLEIPKVMLSRKLRNLEEKNLIKRVPYGNENKIFLK